MRTTTLLLLFLPFYLAAPIDNVGDDKKVDPNTHRDIEREEKMFHFDISGDINLGSAPVNGHHIGHHINIHSHGHSGQVHDGDDGHTHGHSGQVHDGDDGHTHQKHLDIDSHQHTDHVHVPGILLQSFRRLGVLMKSMSSQLREKLVSFEKNAPEETSDQTSLIDTMKEATKYLKDNCASQNSNCESVKILEFANDLQSKFEKIGKIGKISPNFMNFFEMERNNLKSAISLCENKRVSGFPGSEEQICTEGGRCMKRCEVTDVEKINEPGHLAVLKEDCYCAENGGQICPKQLEGHSCPNICEKTYGCTLDLCPFLMILF